MHYTFNSLALYFSFQVTCLWVIFLAKFSRSFCPLATEQHFMAVFTKHNDHYNFCHDLSR